MKNSVFFLFVIITANLLNACRNDLMPPEEEQDFAGKFPAASRAELSDARSWYKSHEQELLLTRSGQGHPLFEAVVPNWNESFAGRNETCQTIETALGFLNRKRIVTEECSRKYQETGDLRYLQVLTRLVVMTDVETGNVRGFFMTLIPSQQYLESTAFMPFFNTYTERDKHLGGYVVYHELNGEFINGWVYEEGEIKYALSKHNDSLPQTRNYVATCAPSYIESCTDWYYSTNGGDWIYNGTTCRPPEYTGDECWDYQEVTEPNPGGGVGGGSSGIQAEWKGMSNKLKTVFRRHTLGENISLVNSAFEKMLENCAYEQLYNYLCSQENWDTIHISATLMGNASVTLQGSLYFSSLDNINVENMEHEFYHMFQIRYNGMTRFDNLRGMMEFEGALFRDIKRFVEINGKWKEQTDWGWACFDGTSRTKYQTEYTDWLKKLTAGGTTYPTEINIDEFKDWSIKFCSVAVGTLQNYTYGLNYSLTLPYILGKMKDNCLKTTTP